jgi:hypothetical protein
MSFNRQKQRPGGLSLQLLEGQVQQRSAGVLLQEMLQCRCEAYTQGRAACILAAQTCIILMKVMLICAANMHAAVIAPGKASQGASMPPCSTSVTRPRPESRACDLE